MIITRTMRICYTTAENEHITEEHTINGNLINEVCDRLTAIREQQPNACIRLIMFYSTHKEALPEDEEITIITAANGALIPSGK